MTKRTWTHAELVERAGRWLQNSAKIRDSSFADRRIVGVRCAAVLLEAIGGSENPDAIGWFNRGLTSILIECKASRGDASADLKKIVRRVPKLGMGTYRFYLTLPGIIRPEEVRDSGWGLLEVRGRTVMMIEASKEHQANTRNEMGMLYSAVRKAQATEKKV